MNANFTFQGRNSHHIESISGIPADKLYEIRGILAKHLATKPKAEAVFRAARDAVEEVDGLDEVSISDLWYYAMYMNYVDLYDGDEQSAMQSWRPVSGKAFELFVEWLYGTNTPDNISVRRVGRDQRQDLAEVLGADGWESNEDGKLDLIIGYEQGHDWYIIGGIHVKPSFKGRVQHDVKFSEKLIENGMFSPIVTMDIWSPEGEVENKGQLNSETGINEQPRQVVEDDGAFTNIYSFSDKTDETEDNTPSGYGVKDMDSFSTDIQRFAENFVQRDDIDRFKVA